MNRLIWYFLGYVELELMGASPQWALNALTKNRIPFWNMRWIDPLHVQIVCLKRDRQMAEQLTAGAMCSAAQLREVGFFHAWFGVWHRPILLSGLLLGMVGAMVLPQFLWFYEVEGNETVPEQKLLRTLQELEIGPGFYGPDIDPKWIKDHMLERLPELQWATVTQHGCKAKLVVRERPPTPETVNRKRYANVYATRAGLLTEQFILAGQAVCKPGDVVMPGDLLVSGLVDLENHYLIRYAEAEIYARTWRKVLVKTPSYCLEKRYTGASFHQLFLEIGSRRIKIFGNSGISYASCDKMISRKILSLPGKQKLPLALVWITQRPYETQEQRRPLQWTQTALEQYARDRLLRDMQAGEILHADLQLQQEERCCVLRGTAECREMIARTVEAEWNEEDFKHD